GRRFHRDVVHVRAGNVGELPVDPALLVRVHGDRGFDQGARGLAGLAGVQRASLGVLADDQRPGFLARDHLHQRAGGGRFVGSLDAQLRVVGWVAGLAFDDLEIVEAQQQLAHALRVRRVLALHHRPAVRLLAQGGAAAVALRQADLADLGERGREIGEYPPTAGQRLLMGAIHIERHAGAEQHRGHARENSDLFAGHVVAPLRSIAMAWRRRLRHSQTRIPAPATSNGISRMSTTFSQKPSDWMSASTPAMTARNSLRMSTCFALKRSISCVCSADRMDSLPAGRWLCNFSSLSLVTLSSVSSWAFLALICASALRRISATFVNGRAYGARPRMLTRSLLPARLSSAFHTSSPLLANGCAMICPNTLFDCTQVRSASMSVSAITITFSGLADTLSAPASAVTPGGGPLAKALFAVPETRAPSTNWPVGLKPSRSVDGSWSITNRCLGISPACLLEWISGSNLSLEPATCLSAPAVIRLTLSKFVVITSLAKLEASRPRM